MIKIASDPEAEKNSYLKKLYRLIKYPTTLEKHWNKEELSLKELSEAFYKKYEKFDVPGSQLYFSENTLYSYVKNYNVFLLALNKYGLKVEFNALLNTDELLLRFLIKEIIKQKPEYNKAYIEVPKHLGFTPEWWNYIWSK